MSHNWHYAKLLLPRSGSRAPKQFATRSCSWGTPSLGLGKEDERSSLRLIALDSHIFPSYGYLHHEREVTVRPISFILIAVLLLSVACVFALRGSGNYEYEVQNEEPDSLISCKADSIPADSLDEFLDDDFDLLDTEE